MRYAGPAYRGHNPRWSFAPTSGEGAAIRGGRFNPRGVPALYLATTIEGAFHEATQGLAFKFNPLTLCAYEVDCVDIVDLTTGAGRMKAGIPLDDMSSAWSADLSNGIRPASWNVYDLLHDASAGILVPSFAHRATSRMTNLVLWDWSGEGPHRVRVHDPERRLPHDASSWE